MSEIELSVSIVNFNTLSDVIKLIDSIYRYAGSIALEVLLVDNASKDNVDVITETFRDVKIIKNKVNVFFTKADNQNLKRALGKYILSINSDCLITPGSIQSMISYLDSNPRVGAVTPRIFFQNGETQASIGNFVTRMFGLFFFSGITRFFPDTKVNRHVMPSTIAYDAEEVQDAEVLYGACIMIRREIINTVGVKDENLIHGWDEYDWCRRISKAGWRLNYIPDATVIHHRSLSREKAEVSSDLKKLLSKYDNDGLLYLYKKHYGFALYSVLVTCSYISRVKSHLIGVIKKTFDNE